MSFRAHFWCVECLYVGIRSAQALFAVQILVWQLVWIENPDITKEDGNKTNQKRILTKPNLGCPNISHLQKREAQRDDETYSR
jgi:hypothetical protein